MKIDFDMLEKIIEAGATGAVVLAFLREQHDRKGPRRAADVKRKRYGKVRKGAETMRMAEDTDAKAVRDEATLTDTPRARLFREAKPALLTLGVSDHRAGGLIVGWLKLTHDDDQLVLATILKAQSLNVAEAPSYILATLKGRTNGNGTGADRSNSATVNQQSGSAAIIAGVAAAAERRGRERSAAGQHGPTPGNGDVAREPDFEFGAAPNG